MTSEAAGSPPSAMAWPPPSFANTNVEALVNDLEDEEVSGMMMRARPFATVRFVFYFVNLLPLLL
jgi:hypothetical protein